MTTLDFPRLAGYAGVSVVIGGHTIERREYDWHGEAVTQEPVVAVAFVVDPHGVRWCKSQRAREWGLPIRLLLGWYDDVGRDVQVSWSVGGGQRLSRTMLHAAATPTLPLGPERVSLETGTVQRVFTLPGEPVVTCWGLFLPAEAVRVGRNGLWHLRRSEREGVPEPLRGVLSYGRTGTLGIGGEPDGLA